MGTAAWETLKVFFKIIGGVILFGLVWYGFPAGVGPVVGIFGGLIGLLLNCWALYAFLRYRQGRQEELLQVLIAATESGMPLAPAVDAYRRDRPKRGPIRQWLRTIAFFVLPLYGYVRGWVGLRSYDRLLQIFVGRLESGESLTEAFAAAPGVATRETRLAAEVGQATGQLGLCLGSIGRHSAGFHWLEAAPQLLYPCLVLVIVFGITTFLMVAIIPKYKRIFDEFGMKLPSPTENLVGIAMWFSDYWWIVQSMQLLALLGIAALVALPGVRWRTPIVGRLYRWGVQADILRTLGRFLGAGRTVPDALEKLAASAALPEPARRRLTSASAASSAGEPLAESLRSAELLPAAMAPLVTAAGRTGTLPWALVELGDHLSGRAMKLLKRVTLIVSPLAVIAVGVLVGFIGLGMFVPLIELMNGLGE